MKEICPNKILSYFYLERKLVFWISVCGTLCSLFMVSINVMEGKLVDALMMRVSFEELLFLAVSFVLVVTVIQLLRLSKRYLTRKFANKTILNMRSMMFSQMISEPLSVLEKSKSGDMMTRLISDIEVCAEGMRKVMTEVFDTGMLIISYLAGLFMYDISLTLVALLCIPLASVVAILMKRFVEKKTSIYRKTVSENANLTMEQCKNVLLYRIHSVEDKALKEYDASLQDLKRKAIVVAILENALVPLYQILSMTGMIFVIIIGARYVMEGSWSVGNFTAYISIYILLAEKSSKVAKIMNITQKAKVSWLRVKSYMKSEQMVQKENRSCEVCEMRVEHFSFSYPQRNQKIINDLHFTLKRGEMVGVCSPIGLGKSTLLLALLGQYPYEGKILFDGKDAHDHCHEQVFAYLAHDAFLMSDTIEENIRMGREGNMRQALSDASFEADLQRMEDKEKTQVGSSGHALSNGQRQRVALARALYSKSSFLLLDDPFASLDEKTSEEIFNHLKEHRDQGIMIATHKMKLMPEFDWILCLEENGFSLGTHEQLIRTSTTYQQIYEQKEEE